MLFSDLFFISNLLRRSFITAYIIKGFNYLLLDGNQIIEIQRIEAIVNQTDTKV